MQILGNECYFHFRHLAHNRNKFELRKSKRACLEKWCKTSRISPVYPLSSPPCHEEEFLKEWYLLFFGPCHPFHFFNKISILTEEDNIWVGFGIYNIICATKSKSRADEMFKLLSAKNISCEIWTVKDSLIVYSDTSIHNEIKPLFDYNVIRSIKKKYAPLKLPLLEFSPLISSILAKSANLSKGFHEDLKKIHNDILNDLTDEDFDINERFDILTTSNAALSSFCNQAFTGIYPITKTCASLSSHSLFGIGIAAIALWNVKKQIETFFEKMLITDRVIAFDQFDAIDINKPKNDGIWKNDYLIKVPINDQENFDFQKMVPFYSGRDGFKSSMRSISAPLACVEASNMQSWSLITITHEMVHRITDSVLGILFEDLNDKQLSSLIEKLKDKTLCDNLLDSMKLLLIQGLVAIHSIKRFPNSLPQDSEFDPTLNNIQNAFKTNERIINEVITHVVDCRYFYEQNPSFYIKALWTSWNTIPSISERVEEYLLRTLCGLMSNHLSRENNLKIVKSELDRGLEECLDPNSSNSFIEKALIHLRNDSTWEKLEKRTTAFIPIVRMASTFLFSEKLAGRYSQREEVLTSKSGGSVRDGYPLKPLVFQRDKITNVLRFILRYADGRTFSRVQSLWVLYQIAFAKI